MADIIDLAISTAKSAYKIADKLKNTDLLMKIAELNAQLADVKILEASTRLENLELKAKLQEDTENPLTISREGILFDAQHNPYCTGCFCNSHKRVHLRTDNAISGWALYSCPVCKEIYQEGKSHR
jgi:hypothetical protein